MSEAFARLKAALEGRYRIERELGEGGMATVYVAEDLKHERRVALKVLKPELAAVVGAARFLAEIKTTANLQHPHILPLHDSGEVDGLLFYVMPYVEGESLRDRLDREHQLPVDEAVGIARDVAEALDYAHRRGVVHRDIKPANILLQEGKPVVADFGIALALDTVGEDRLTHTGLSIGTPHYMSPEQATADRPVDARSDVFSLAAVLYEMLTGEPPHTGRTTPALMAKLVSERPTPLRVVREAVPEHVDAAVARALAKLPADRHPSASDFAAALGSGQGAGLPTDKTWSVPASPGWFRPRALIPIVVLAGVGAAAFGVVVQDDDPPPNPDRLVVAPFENRTGDPGLDEVGAFVAEQVAFGMSRSGWVEVPPAAAVRRVWLAGHEAGEALSDAERAERLEASTVVSGSYDLEGGRIRFRGEIVDTRSGDLVAPLNVVSVHADSIESAIARLGENALTELAVRSQSVSSQRHVFSAPLSFESWLAGERGLERFNDGDMQAALLSFQQAFALDSTNTHAVLRIANSLANLGRNAEADSALLQLDRLRGRLTAYERAYEDWIRSLYLRGDLRAEDRAARAMFRLDPNMASAYVSGLAALKNDRPRETVGTMSAYAETPAAARWLYFWTPLLRAHHLLGEYDQQLSVVRQARRLRGDPGFATADEVAALAALGRVDELDQLMTDGSAAHLFRAAQELRVHGYPDEARAYLERARGAYEALPPAEDVRFALGQAMYEAGEWDEAGALFAQLTEDVPDDLDYLGWYGVSLARRGLRADAEGVSETLRAWPSSSLPGRNTFWRARIAAVLGDDEGALRLMQQARDEGVPYSCCAGTRGDSETYHATPDFDSLRSTRAFQDLVRAKG